MKKTVLLLIMFLVICSTFANDISLKRKSLIMSTLWQATSAEYHALAYQAYNIARLRLDEDLEIKRELKRAIIVDADETVIDNSAFQARVIVDGQEYKTDFDNWVSSAEAEAVPGALEFLNYAHQQGCEIFYISNRGVRHLEGTRKNLEKLGFPQAVESHILLKSDSSNKGIRRDLVKKDHYIVMLIGDNLIDFEDIFRKKDMQQRYNSVEQFKDEFGKKFIVLPNPMYGEWEKTLYGGTRHIPQIEKEKKLWEFLEKAK